MFRTKKNYFGINLTELCTSNIIDNDSELVEWKDDDSNASDDFILVSPKRNRRPPNKLILSVPKKKKRIGKTKACNPSQDGTMGKGNPGPMKPLSKNNKPSIIK